VIATMVQSFYQRHQAQVALGARAQYPDLGILTSGPSPYADASPCGVVGPERRGVDYEASPALRPVRRASVQLANSHAGLRAAVVQVSCSTTPISEALPILAPLMAASPEEYGCLDAVFLVNSPPTAGGTGTNVICGVLPWARHPIQQMRWPHGLTAWRCI